MAKWLPGEVMHRFKTRFTRLYGETAPRCLERLAMLVGRYGVGIDPQPTPYRWDQRDAVLITYGDMVQAPSEKPLLTLHRFLTHHLQGVINTVHILPFFPYSSDDGFSVIDYRTVNPALGTWQDIQAIGADFRLMVDLVLNHVSRQSEWFRDYVEGIAPARDYFITVDPQTDLSQVVRPRSTPLLTPVQTQEGGRYLWTTFSTDQVDLNFANPDVLFEFLDILLLYISMGARIIRLDAIAYLWKKIGTPCIHLPETHEIVKLLRDFLTLVAPHVLLLTETNVPHAENISYFGNGDEAHLVYQFSLPPLLLHALQTGNSRYLTRWAASLPSLPTGCTVLNFTASHDGIGVRPLHGLIPEEEFSRLVEGIRQRGGYISMKRDTDGSESPYELNITYFDALSDPEDPDMDRQVARFLCSQAVMLALQGIPAIYFHSLTATPNDEAAVRRTGHARAINRKRWDAHSLEALLQDASTITARVFRSYLHLLRLRARHPAFHPEGVQRILDLGDSLFALERTAPDQSETIVALHNVTAHTVTVPIDRIPSLQKAGQGKELITGRTMKPVPRTLRLSPYATAWIRVSPPH